jgi:hypothetical protein
MDVVNKEKIKLWKEKNKGTDNYFKVIKLEDDYKICDDTIGASIAGLSILTIFTLMIALPVTLPAGMCIVMCNSSKMSNIENEMGIIIEGTFK